MIELSGIDAAKGLNRLAFYQSIEILLRDITIDLTVCKIEGWDHKQYITELKAIVDDLYFKITKTKDL